MIGFIERLMNGSLIEKGILVMLGGMLGVFIVLIIFYFLIKLLIRVFPYKPDEN